MISRRVIVSGKGGPEVLQVIEETVPEPGRHQVRIRVHAAGVAFGDVMRRRGVLAPPWAFTPGYDVVGVVDAVGSSVTDVALGARVAAMMPGPGFGGYADHVLVKSSRLVLVPDGVDDTNAVALGLNYITAYQLIHRFVPLKAGQRALVHGAAGGVGTAMLDLGGLAGVELFGTASKGKHSYLEARGCTAIDYRNEDFVERMAELAPDGVDAVFDGIGGAHLARSYKTLNGRGTLVMFGISGDLSKGVGALATGLAHFSKLKLCMDGRQVKMYNITSSRGSTPTDCRNDWRSCLDLHAEGKITPMIGATLPLEHVGEAHRMLDESAVIGKIVLTMGLDAST